MHNAYIHYIVLMSSLKNDSCNKTFLTLFFYFFIFDFLLRFINIIIILFLNKTNLARDASSHFSLLQFLVFECLGQTRSDIDRAL